MNEFVKLMDRFDPTRELRTALLEGGAALPRTYLTNLNRLADQATPLTLAEALRPGEVNLSKMVGLRTDQAKELLGGAKVSVVERELAADAEVPALRALTASPFASANDTIVLFKKGDKVAGFGRYDSSERLRQTEAEVARLKEEMKKLRDELRPRPKESSPSDQKHGAKRKP